MEIWLKIEGEKFENWGRIGGKLVRIGKNWVKGGGNQGKSGNIG